MPDRLAGARNLIIGAGGKNSKCKPTVALRLRSSLTITAPNVTRRLAPARAYR